MNYFRRFFSRLRPFFAVIAIAFSISLCFFTTPLLAQNGNVSAPVLLDGRKIFDVSQSGSYSAEGRAAEASRILQEYVETAETRIPINVNYDGDLPVLEIGEEQSYFISVTSEDAPRGRSVEEQARRWTTQIDNALVRAQNERTFRYLVRASILSLLIILFAFFLSWILGRVWHRWLVPLLSKDDIEITNPSDSRPTLSAKIGGQTLLFLLRVTIWLFVVLHISGLFPQTRQISRTLTDGILLSLTSDLIPLGDSSYSVLDFIILIGLFASLFIIARTIRKLLRTRVLRLTGLNRSAQETIAVVFNYTFIFIGTIIVLQLWGLDLTSLTVFAGVLGVGVGLGLQGIAKEFLSGLVLIFERPIQVGAFVEVGELKGTVERIGVRSTEIRTVDNVAVILPNSRFLESEVINWSHRTSLSRLRLPVGVAYGSDTEIVRNALIEAAKEHADVLSNPNPIVFFRGFTGSALDFELLVWIAEPRRQFQIKSDLYFRIEASLRRHEIIIPFPQQDLHLRSGDLPIKLSPELVNSLTALSNNLSAWLHHQSNGGSSHSKRKNSDSNETESEFRS